MNLFKSKKKRLLDITEKELKSKKDELKKVSSMYHRGKNAAMKGANVNYDILYSHKDDMTSLNQRIITLYKRLDKINK